MEKPEYIKHFIGHHNVKTDTNFFIDTRLYFDPSIILFYLFRFRFKSLDVPSITCPINYGIF